MVANEIAIGVSAFVALLVGAIVLSIVAERVGVPGAVLLVGAGIVAGAIWHVRPPFDFSNALLFIFLPPLIFEAAWNVHLGELRLAWKAIALLALPGTLVVAFAIAFGITALGALPFGAALVYGAIVAATDPVAVVAVFRKFPVPANVKTIVEAESISNDGVALVLYSSALTVALGGGVDWFAAIGHGVLAIVGGVAIGTVAAYVAWIVLRFTDAAEHEVTITVVAAYLAYLAADRLGLSGIFATAAAGIVLRALEQRNVSHIANVEDADRFWNTTAYIANAIVFIATGLLIDLSRVAHEPLTIAIAIAIVLASRALIVLAILRERRVRVAAFLAGMRGALPLALALALPPALPFRAEIVDAVFATVFVTLVLQGIPLEPVIRRLYPATLR